MPSPTPLPSRPFDPLSLCPALILGWVAFDLAGYGMQGNPQLAQALLPASCVALLLAFIAGRLWRDWPLFMPLLAGAALIGSLLPMLMQLPGGEALRWLPRCVLVQSITLLGLGVLVRRSELPINRLACSLGACLAIGFAWLLEKKAGASLSFETPILFTLAASLVAGLSALLPATRRLPVGALCALAWLAAVISSGYGAQALRRPDQEATLEAQGQTPNLLLVVFDTVRADHLPSYGYWRKTTPNIDRLVGSQATRYSDSRATSSWTLPSHASLFTGLFPDEHGATRPRPEDASGLDLQAWPACALRPDVEPLAERLLHAGFDTAAVVANITFLRHEFGLDRGFLHYDDRVSTYLPKRLALGQLFGKLKRVGALPYRGAEEVTSNALHWLDRHFDEHQNAPFFLMLNYMDAHAPQLPQAPYGQAFDTPMPEFEAGPEGFAMRQRYMDELAYDRGLLYADSQLGLVLEDLESRGQLENTVVVMTSDHGEAFGEHGYWLHGWHLHGETVKVPLLIKQAGAAAKMQVDSNPVTGADVMNLVLAALDLPQAKLRDEAAASLARGMIGQLYMTDHLIAKFADKGWDNPGLGQMAWLEGSRKVLVRLDGSAQAFDLEQDPNELSPLMLSEEELASARSRAKAWWAAHPPLQVKGGAMSAEDRNRLGDLGYMGEEEE